MTMKIGQIETSGEPGRRDAFHVPAVLVKCSVQMDPCTSVRFTDETFTEVRKCVVGETQHGIADPLLTKVITPGELFWVLLMPDTVNQLVHHFNLQINDLAVPEIAPVQVQPQPIPEPPIPTFDGWDEAERIRCRGCY